MLSMTSSTVFPLEVAYSSSFITKLKSAVTCHQVEIAEPTTLSTDCGLFDLAVELSPSCNLKLDERRLMDHGAHIAQQLQSFITSSGTFNLKDLCIIPGRFCWKVCVDLLVLQMDGDPLDACSIAAYVALNCTKIPKVEIFLGESGCPEDFEVTGDLGEALSLNAKNIPICISSSKVLVFCLSAATLALHLIHTQSELFSFHFI